MKNLNRKSSYYFSGNPKVVGGFFQPRSAEYNRFIRTYAAPKTEAENSKENSVNKFNEDIK